MSNQAMELDNLETFDLLQADNAWEAAEQFAEAQAGWHSVADLISRVVPNPFNNSRRILK
jgi:hypothetical protein